MKNFIQTAVAGSLSAGFLTICLTMVAFLFQHTEIQVSPIILVFFIAAFLNLAGLTAVRIYMTRYREKCETRTINEALSSDEKSRNMFNWCLGYGMVVTLLTVLFYAIATELDRQLPFDYAFLVFTLMPVAPWTGRIAIDQYNDLIDDTPLSACFFHIGET